VKQGFKHSVTYKSVPPRISATITPAFSIVPNPSDAATGIFIQVDAEELGEPWLVQVHDIQGRLVHTSRRTGNAFRIEGIRGTGIYSATLSNSYFSSTQRFVLN